MPIIIDLTNEARPLLADGTYEAEIETVNASYSKSSGNPMLTVVLTIENEGEVYKIYDYLTITDPTSSKRGSGWKIGTIQAALGLEASKLVIEAETWQEAKPEILEQLESIAEGLIGGVLNVRLETKTGTEIDPATGKPYPPKNTVAKYTALEGSADDFINDL